MSAGPENRPETIVLSEIGRILRRDIRPFDVTYKGETVTVDMPGYYADGDDGDAVFVGKDLHVSSEALRGLKERIDRVPTPESIRRVRTKLKLSQREAGAVFRVGENAFDKYERGLIEPGGPTIQLMKVLDRHPGLVKELR